MKMTRDMPINAYADHSDQQPERSDSDMLLSAILEATADGILVVDSRGQVLKANRRFLDMWRIPDSLMSEEDDNAMLSFAAGHLLEPERFLARVKELYKSSRERFGVLNFKDGRIFERYSRPLIVDGQLAGGVWIFRDVTKRKRMERRLQRISADLEKKVSERTVELARANDALKVLLQQNAEAKAELERRVLENINMFILPQIEALEKLISGDKLRSYLNILRTNLDLITSSFSEQLSLNNLGRLTPREMQIANFVRHGNSSKEIADLLGLSVRTVESYRDSLRKKLGLKNKKVNLRSYLLSLR
ncbi:MAG TPA: PAS domain-containing protein [Thermodesulfobacteriaceae bacterium]|nr:PAS domain-containing protein [Thermodesulfobacteriaceae bacterium]